MENYILQHKKRDSIGPSSKSHNPNITDIFHFTSGWVDTQHKLSQKYGRFEANCSLPPKNVTGIWPAFWLLPEHKHCWPTGGEIDIFEYTGNWVPKLGENIWGSYHWGTECGNDNAKLPGSSYRPLNSHKNWQTEWHVYAIEWKEDYIEYFVDNISYFKVTSKEVNMPPSPMYIIFNQGVSPIFRPNFGPDTYGKVGQTLQIEWIKLFN